MTTYHLYTIRTIVRLFLICHLGERSITILMGLGPHIAAGVGIYVKILEAYQVEGNK